jgi:hypothetical protein
LHDVGDVGRIEVDGETDAFELSMRCIRALLALT